MTDGAVDASRAADPPRTGRGADGAREARRGRGRTYGLLGCGVLLAVPSVLLVGVIIGWILGGRAARDAYAMELKKREARDRKRDRTNPEP